MSQFSPVDDDPSSLVERQHGERLAQELRLEQRSYLEQVEEAVAEVEAASTPLDLRLLQLGNRSVELSVEVADRQLLGRIVHVAGELATLETVGGDRFFLVVGRLAAIRLRDEPGTPRGVDTGGPSTLVAKLREVWSSGERCTIGRTAGPAVVGDIRAVTEGHIELVDPQGVHWLLNTDTIAWVGPKN